MKKILFIAAHRLDRSPGQRFRFEQYFSYLNQNGYECSFSFLISEKDDKYFYSKGNYLKKALILIKSIFIRLKDVLTSGRYDIIFIQREAFITGSTLFERLFSWSSAKLIFDFDDSVWLLQKTDRSANKNLLWLKNPSKTSKIIKMSDMIFAGNQYLADYAASFNKNIVIIPTTIDIHEYQSGSEKKNSGIICIGWSGSFSTIDHFTLALPALKSIKNKYQDRVTFKVIGDGNYTNEELGIKGIAWNKQDEIKELSFIDIGIMPLPDDEWSKGKCGLKGLQYMALGIPTIMSPVGVNKLIIQDGENGFLASEKEEWVNKISKLIEDTELRMKIGEAGRKTVLENYSVDSQKSRYLKYFNQLIES